MARTRTWITECAPSVDYFTRCFVQRGTRWLRLGKKVPPAPGRTDIYDRMGEFLRLPAGELSKLADVQRQEELRKRVAEPARPLFKECRELILRKCEPERKREISRIFEKEPFGECE